MYQPDITDEASERTVAAAARIAWESTCQERQGKRPEINFCGGSVCSSGAQHCNKAVLIPEILAKGHVKDNIIFVSCYCAQFLKRINSQGPHDKISPSDPCPCGSGKIHKKCGMLEQDWIEMKNDQCAYCAKSSAEVKLKRCSACKSARYCCREHQVLHRPQHKNECAKLKQQRKQIKKPMILTHAGHQLVTVEDIQNCFIDLYENHSYAKKQDAVAQNILCAGCNLRIGYVDVNITQNINTVHGNFGKGKGRNTKYKGKYKKNKRLHLCFECIALHGGACDFANPFLDEGRTLREEIERVQQVFSDQFPQQTNYKKFNVHNNFGQGNKSESVLLSASDCLKELLKEE